VTIPASSALAGFPFRRLDDLGVTERVRQAAAGSEKVDAVVHTAWEVDQLLESRRPNAALDWGR